MYLFFFFFFNFVESWVRSIERQHMASQSAVKPAKSVFSHCISIRNTPFFFPRGHILRISSDILMYTYLCERTGFYEICKFRWSRHSLIRKSFNGTWNNELSCQNDKCVGVSSSEQRLTEFNLSFIRSRYTLNHVS